MHGQRMAQLAQVQVELGGTAGVAGGDRLRPRIDQILSLDRAELGRRLGLNEVVDAR